MKLRLLSAEVKVDETTESDEGPIKLIDPEKVPKEPYPLIEGFEWVTMDLMQDAQVGYREFGVAVATNLSTAKGGVRASNRSLR